MSAAGTLADEPEPHDTNPRAAATTAIIFTNFIIFYYLMVSCSTKE